MDQRRHHKGKLKIRKGVEMKTHMHLWHVANAGKFRGKFIAIEAYIKHL